MRRTPSDAVVGQICLVGFQILILIQSCVAWCAGLFSVFGTISQSLVVLIALRDYS